MRIEKRILFAVFALIVLFGPVLSPIPVWAATTVTVNAANNSASVSPASITAGSPTTVTAIGDRQDAEGKMSGDERYIPFAWTSTEEGKDGTFTVSEGNYTSIYTPSSAGSYTVTATFQKQIWNGIEWTIAEEPKDTKTASLTATEVVIPIAANAANNSASVSPASVTAGSPTTVTVIGDRQDAEGETLGDERYIPFAWTSTEEGKDGTFTVSEGNYTFIYTPSSAGSYTVTATFQKQIWNGIEWTVAEEPKDTKTASLTVNSSSSGSNRSHSHSGGSNSSVTSPVLSALVESSGFSKTVPVAVDGASTSAKACVDKSILLEAFGKSNADSSGISKVTVQMPVVEEVQSYSLELPVGMISSQTADKTVEIKTGIATIAVPENMLASNASAAQNVVLTIAAGDRSKLDTALQAQIGDRPVIELNLKVDGKQTAWKNDSAPVAVSVPYTPTAEELANPESIVIWYIDGSGKAVSVPNGHYDPAAGTVTFATTHFSNYAVGYNKVSFDDMAGDVWYKKAVGFIAARGITTGTGSGKFSPEARLTRGEFIVLMMRAYDITPDSDPKDNFSDAGNTWYTGYLAAVKRLGISAGVGNNMFAPVKEITRQEMFTLMYNALKVLDQLPQGASEETMLDFSDAGDIASWAKDAMTLLVQTRIITGSDGKLDPNVTATRAELAQVLYKLLMEQ